tara:strand:+ start:192 stop:341 length:150 start_codon:yes stop_codon:yes gene_type:complete
MESILNNPLAIWGVIIAAVSIVGFTWFFYQSLVDGGPDTEREAPASSEE